MNTYILKPQLSVTSIGEEAVLLDLDSGQYFGLNEVGTKIIAGLMQQLELDDIVQEVINEFEVSETQAHTDTRALIDDLEGAGLISRSNLEA
jgi:hypothetical protein